MIKSRICQSGATIVVQILSSASASKAPTAYFPLIKTLNNNYNLCSVSLSAVRKYWSHWEQKESFSVFLEFLVSHFEQLNGLSLAWILAILEFLASHFEQMNGFSSVWILLRIFKWLNWLNVLPNFQQLNGLFEQQLNQHPRIGKRRIFSSFCMKFSNYLMFGMLCHNFSSWMVSQRCGFFQASL